LGLSEQRLQPNILYDNWDGQNSKENFWWHVSTEPSVRWLEDRRGA